ncbi:hypothetical protein NNX28_17030 [Arthrobacter sp. zg-Y859]|uniref:Uncharacterized protein n=1 Tax=Arthrobacter jinronghuae TaxID=2964609 RepID=A0ABT1NYM5_9MICC|nr:hypothetical protein [Arthrobacter jinronghuae]MCQ1951624.1 hypothetical protein [Arthrobacter jinronghuae]UWX79662.1 hypothetical protein N2K98_05550 [Arthrobacter jinronghuae]
MAVILPSTINADDATKLPKYSAEVMRRNMGAAFAQSSPGVNRSGVLGAAPTTDLSGSVVRVGPFMCVIGTAKGAYVTGVDSVTNAEGSVGVADPTNPRIDRVVLEVLDPDNGGAAGSRKGVLRVIAGKPAALPGLPALPVNSLHIAQVYVPRAGNGGPTMTVDCPFTATAGAPIPVRDVDDRNSLALYEGLRVARLDLAGREQVYSGSRWESGLRMLSDTAHQEALTGLTATVSVSTDGNGFAGYIFKNPFPNALVSAELTSVYQGNYIGLVHYQLDEGLSGRTRLALACRASDGSLVKNVANLRLTFTAYGY